MMRKRLAILLTAALAPLVVAPVAAATPLDTAPGCVTDGGMAFDRCEANYVNDMNNLLGPHWPVLDDGNPQRAQMLEIGRHLVNNLTRKINKRAAAAGSLGADGVVSAFDEVVTKAVVDSTQPGKISLTPPQAFDVVMLAVHWFGPSGLETAVRDSLKEVGR